jgi:uncharacterized repeat protein (TIGR03803 family)
MESEKCLRVLASALTIAAAVLASSGAARASSYKVIHQFEVPKEPTANLTMDAAGNLYGTALGGGSTACPNYGCGMVWKLTRNSNGTWGALTVLHEFTGGADGANPFRAGLIFDAASNLYGTTSSGGDTTACTMGGPPGCGVVFKLAPNAEGTWAETVLYTFTGGADGATPYAGLILDAAGNLYGETDGGGSSTYCLYGCGVVFKLAPNPDGTWAETVLYSFPGGADGYAPQGGLIFDAAGNLYGTTSQGGACTACGVVFKLAPNPDGTWAETVLYSFTGGADGAYSTTGLIFDAAGNLYGTTFEGGSGYGVVFKLAPSPDGNWTESVLYSFTDGTDGANPAAGLIFDAAGNLYGTTWAGGDTVACRPYGLPHGCGVVFELTPTSSGWSETVLRKFLGEAENPQAPLIFDPKGNLYGTTEVGTGNYGVVFEITP